MKKALKDFRTYLFGSFLAVISIGLPYLLFFVIKEKEPFQYPLLHVAIAAFYFLVGFIYADIYLIIYRKKNDAWNEEIPQEKKDSAWLRRMPFYFAAILTIIVFLVSQVFSWITGSYPFM